MSLSWESLIGVGVVVLALAFAFGLWRNARRNRANDPVTEAAAEALIDDPEGYEQGGRERLERKIRP